MANLFSLEGKNAWITGASYGIGFNIAKAFVAAGIKTIIFNDINEAALERGLNNYKEAGIENVKGYVCDVTKEDDVKAVTDAIALGTALDYVKHIGLHNIEAHEHDLTEYARQQLALVPGLTLIGNPKHRVSVVSFVLDGIDVPLTGQLLDKEGIAVRAGHHCAQPALRALGYEMSVRPTFALYNTRDEVDRLVIALRKIVQQ